MEHLRNIGLSCSAKSDKLLAERQNMLRNGMKEEGSTLRSSIHAAQRPIAFSSQDAARCGQVITALAGAQVFQTPTMALNTRGAFRQFLKPRQRAPFAFLPAPVRDRWNAFADAAAATPIDPAYAAFADWSLAMVKQVKRRGRSHHGRHRHTNRPPDTWFQPSPGNGNIGASRPYATRGTYGCNASPSAIFRVGRKNGHH